MPHFAEQKIGYGIGGLCVLGPLAARTQRPGLLHTHFPGQDMLGAAAAA